MKIKDKIPTILSTLVLCLLIVLTGVNGTSEPKKTKIKVKTVSKESPSEIRGLWVTYMDLDMSSTDRSKTAFTQKFETIVNTAKQKKFNTLYVHVRPFCDALYRSEYFPHSHILSGKQGADPNYDALKIMCDIAHKKGLSIHAWINPYRVRHSGGQKLSNNNPYKKNPSIGAKTKDGIMLNPTNEEARKLIENGVREVCEKYDTDGVQFDDYFYPENDNDFDKDDYKTYKENAGSEKALSLREWRSENVNILISECNAIAHKYGKIFGVSPQGNISNNKRLCADVKSWCEKYGYVDYICPQLYYSTDNPALKFEDALKSWMNFDFDSSVTLIVGIAGYKTGTDSDSGTWKNRDDILKSEIELVRKNNIKGFALYSYGDLVDKRAAKEVNNLVDSIEKSD